MIDFRSMLAFGAVWTLTGDAFGVAGIRLLLSCVALGRRGGVAVEGRYDGAEATCSVRSLEDRFRERPLSEIATRMPIAIATPTAPPTIQLTIAMAEAFAERFLLASRLLAISSLVDRDATGSGGGAGGGTAVGPGVDGRSASDVRTLRLAENSLDLLDIACAQALSAEGETAPDEVAR